MGTFLVVQWLRIHLARQGTRVSSLVWKIPGTDEQLSPFTATEPMCPRVRALQQEKPLQEEACAQLESSPHSPQLEKACAQQQRLKNFFK